MIEIAGDKSVVVAVSGLLKSSTKQSETSMTIPLERIQHVPKLGRSLNSKLRWRDNREDTVGNKPGVLGEYELFFYFDQPLGSYEIGANMSCAAWLGGAIVVFLPRCDIMKTHRLLVHPSQHTREHRELSMISLIRPSLSIAISIKSIEIALSESSENIDFYQISGGGYLFTHTPITQIPSSEKTPAPLCINSTNSCRR